MSIHEGNKYCGVIDGQHKKSFLWGSREKRGRNLRSWFQLLLLSFLSLSLKDRLYRRHAHYPEWNKINSKICHISVVNIIKQAKREPKILQWNGNSWPRFSGRSLSYYKTCCSGHSGKTRMWGLLYVLPPVDLCFILCLSQVPHVSLFPWFWPYFALLGVVLYAPNPVCYFRTHLKLWPF